jgi:hypothetical protein
MLLMLGHKLAKMAVTIRYLEAKSSRGTTTT